MNESEVEVGVYGLRTFRIGPEAQLYPLSCPTLAGPSPWVDGACIASCIVGDHQAPGFDCSCGVYCFDNLTELRRQYRRKQAAVPGTWRPARHS